jgi:hypothetical protein
LKSCYIGKYQWQKLAQTIHIDPVQIVVQYSGNYKAHEKRGAGPSPHRPLGSKASNPSCDLPEAHPVDGVPSGNPHAGNLWRAEEGWALKKW